LDVSLFAPGECTMTQPSTPSAPQEDPSETERRAWVRYQNRLDMRWQVFGQGEQTMWPARVEDVSSTGIGMVFNRAVPAGTLLTVRLATTATGWRSYLVRVKHSKPCGVNRFHVGCAFVRPLSTDELGSLLT